MHQVLEEPELFNSLLILSFNTTYSDSHRAAWIVELLCLQDIKFIEEHLDYFVNHLNILINDSAKRPMAKICSLICDPKKGLTLSISQKKKMTSACFDWMIDDSAVAVKVYAMTTLYELGKTTDWVHPALLEILEQNFAASTAGYKCRAKVVMKGIKA